MGQFVGSTALAAVGSTGSLSFLVIGFFMGFGTGSGVIIAQHYGAKEPEEVSKSVHTAMALAIFFGIVLGVIGILIAPGLLKLMNTPDDVMDQAVLYLRIYFGGVITLTVYNIGSGIMRAVGDCISFGSSRSSAGNDRFPAAVFHFGRTGSDENTGILSAGASKNSFS